MKAEQSHCLKKQNQKWLIGKQLTAEDLVTLILAIIQAIAESSLLHTQSRVAQEMALWTGW